MPVTLIKRDTGALIAEATTAEVVAVLNAAADQALDSSKSNGLFESVVQAKAPPGDDDQVFRALNGAATQTIFDITSDASANGVLHMRDSSQAATITLDGSDGDISADGDILVGGSVTADTGFFIDEDTALTNGTLQLGAAATDTGKIRLAGTTSGVVTIQPQDAAGTWTLKLPANDGSSGQVLTTDGNGISTWETPSAAGGTVTHTGGALTSNAVVLGAGTDDVKVVAGITTDGTSQLNLGVNTTTLGKVKMFGNTSGDVTIQPNAVAGTATVLTLPASTDTLVGRATSDTLTNKTLTSPTLTTPILGTPSSGTLTSCTGLPIATGVSGLGTGVATFLATPSSANLKSAVTDETGSGALVFGTSPALATPTVSGLLTGDGLTKMGQITLNNANEYGFGQFTGLYLVRDTSGQNCTLSNEITSGDFIFKCNGEVFRMVNGGGLKMAVAKPLIITSGTNQRAGNATLVGGTVTVSNATVSANTVVMLTVKTAGGTLGSLSYTVTAATSFTITSSSAIDTSVVSYLLIEVP